MNDVNKSIQAAKGIIEMNHGSMENYVSDKTDKKELWMDDVGLICSDSYDFVQGKLKDFGVELTFEQEDKIFNIIQEVLEEVSNGNYRGYN